MVLGFKNCKSVIPSKDSSPGPRISKYKKMSITFSDKDSNRDEVTHLAFHHVLHHIADQYIHLNYDEHISQALPNKVQFDLTSFLQ